MIGFDANDPYVVAGFKSPLAERCVFDRRRADTRGIVRNDRKVVQWMHLFDLSLDLQRAGERDGHVTDRNRHGVSVDQHVAALLVDDQPGAIVVPLGDTGQRVRQVECDDYQGRRHGIRNRIGMPGQFCTARLGRLGRRPGGEVAAWPRALLIVALAAPRREPYPVHFDQAHDRVLRVLHRDVTRLGTLAIGQIVQRGLKVIQVFDRLTVHLDDDRATRNCRFRQQVAGVGNVNSGRRAIVMTGLLVRQLVDNRVAELQVLVRRNLVQIIDRDTGDDAPAATLQLDFDIFADVAVEDRLERHELGNQFAVDANQYIAGRNDLRRRRFRNDVVHGQHAGQIRKHGPCQLLGIGRQSEPTQLVVRLALKSCLQCAARDRLTFLQFLERAVDAIEWQEEAAGGRTVGAGVERDDFAFDIDDRRSRGAARRAGSGLQIKGIEVVVLAAAIIRRLPVKACNGTGEDRQLLAGIVADDTNLLADVGVIGVQRQFFRLDVSQVGGIVAEEAEVVHRVAVDRRQLHFLVIAKHGLGNNGTRGDDVAIGQDQTAPRVDDKAGGLARTVPLGVERASAVDSNRDNA